NSTISAAPESRHSLSVPHGSASSRLRGISLMLMELLAPDDQGIADLQPDDQQDDLLGHHPAPRPATPPAYRSAAARTPPPCTPSRPRPRRQVARHAGLDVDPRPQDRILPRDASAASVRESPGCTVAV